MLLCIGTVMLLAGLTSGAGKEIGKVAGIDTGKGMVIINLGSGVELRMGEMLEVETGSGKIRLEVTYPMLTVAKCKIRGTGRLSDLKKGMTAYRYSADAGKGDEKTGDA